MGPGVPFEPQRLCIPSMEWEASTVVLSSIFSQAGKMIVTSTDCGSRLIYADRQHLITAIVRGQAIRPSCVKTPALRLIKKLEAKASRRFFFHSFSTLFLRVFRILTILLFSFQSLVVSCACCLQFPCPFSRPIQYYLHSVLQACRSTLAFFVTEPFPTSVALILTFLVILL